MADAAPEGQLALCQCAQCVSLRTQKQLMCAHCGLWAYHAQPRDEFSAFDCTCLACSRTYCLVCAKTHAYRRLTQDGEPGDKDDQEYSLSCSRCSRSQEDRLFIDDADLL